MKLPKFDLSALPDLDQITGVFGSLAHSLRVAESDDTLIMLMTFLYDLVPEYRI